MKKIILTIAGSDSSGGAGIQADLKAISANKGFGMSVITVVTAQNSHSVYSIYPLPIIEIEKQIDAVMLDYSIACIKIGALFSNKIIDCVINKIKNQDIPIILDPVMISKAGVKLLSDDIIKNFIEKTNSCTLLITPNIEEAKKILKIDSISSQQEMIDAAKKIKLLGYKNVLLKGGHLNGSKYKYDVLLTNDNKIRIFENEIIDTKNTHGTGCTLSSAIATQYAIDKNIITACEKGIAYTHEAIKNNLDYGRGHGPLDHFYKYDIKK